MLWFIPNRYAVVLKDTCRASFSCALVLRRNLKTPGLSISRIFTEEGPPVFLRLSHSEVNPAPGGAHSADCGSTSILVFRTVILPPGFSVMTRFTKWLPVALIPEQILVTTVGEQCDPQPLLWYSVPASCTPHTAGGSEGTFCLPSASGCHSRALRPAVLPPGGEACAFHKTLSPGSISSGQPGCPQGTLGRRGIFYSSHGKSTFPK